MAVILFIWKYIFFVFWSSSNGTCLQVIDPKLSTPEVFCYIVQYTIL